MSSRLFTSNFIKVCFANFFLFFTLYLCLPITPFESAADLSSQGYAGWQLYFSFVVGLLIGGPFHNYIIEHHSRKRIIFLTYLSIVLPVLVVSYTTLASVYFLALFAQGAAFGLATATTITIAIDVTVPAKRDKGNLIYAWAGRLGMILGLPLSIYIYTAYSYQEIIYATLGAGFLALISLLSTRHPFRAPLQSQALSLDRFILPRGWKMIVIMIAVSFIPGSLFPLFMESWDIKSITKLSDVLVFMILPFVVFLVSAVLSRIEIDSMLHNRGLGYLLIRLPLPLIAAYLLYHYQQEMSFGSLLISAWLLVGLVFSVATALAPHRIYPKINKWVLESQYRVEVTSPIFSGLLCILLALLLEHDLELTGFDSYLIVSQLLVFGLARVSSPVFLLLILSSKHCERGTANTSQHLAWEVGLALGASTSLALGLSLADCLYLGIALVVLSMLIYTHIRYRLHKIAKHKHLS